MQLWNIWITLVNQLQPAFTRKRTFFWFIAILIGYVIKFDLSGVTSIARGVGLLPEYYTCMLNFFTSTSVNLEMLRSLWINLVFNQFSGLVKINGRYLIAGDGIKIAKEGKKMPGVKWLHQESESNSKAEHIMGHSIQIVSILAKGLSTCFSIPLAGMIHEGIKFTYKDNRTLLDKMFLMLVDLKFTAPVYFVADKYYCSGRFMKQLINSGIHIITMMKKNAIAYYAAPQTGNKRLGRPKKYGRGVKLFSLFDAGLNFVTAPMPGNARINIEYCVVELFWKPLGGIAKFVLVRHPEKGNSIPMSTDLSLDPMDIILGYSSRFKIEVMFKQAVHQVGAFMYRFWLKAMRSRKRKSGDQILQFAPTDYKDKIAAKLRAYNLFIQLGLIAHGLMHYLSINYYQLVWNNFGTWLRTIRHNTLPSEKVVALALCRGYVEFLIDDTISIIFKKFLRRRTDISQLQQYIFEQRQTG